MQCAARLSAWGVGGGAERQQQLHALHLARSSRLMQRSIASHGILVVCRSGAALLGQEVNEPSGVPVAGSVEDLLRLLEPSMVGEAERRRSRERFATRLGSSTGRLAGV